MSGSTDLEYGTVELNLDNADSIVMVSILVERSDIVVFSRDYTEPVSSLDLLLEATLDGADLYTFTADFKLLDGTSVSDSQSDVEVLPDTRTVVRLAAIFDGDQPETGTAAVEVIIDDGPVITGATATMTDTTLTVEVEVSDDNVTTYGFGSNFSTDVYEQAIGSHDYDMSLVTSVDAPEILVTAITTDQDGGGAAAVWFRVNKDADGRLYTDIEVVDWNPLLTEAECLEIFKKAEAACKAKPDGAAKSACFVAAHTAFIACMSGP